MLQERQTTRPLEVFSSRFRTGLGLKMIGMSPGMNDLTAMMRGKWREGTGTHFDTEMELEGSQSRSGLM